MPSHETDRATKIAVVASLFAAAALPSISVAQSDASSRIAELLDQIQAVESSQGENSAALIALFAELGLRYQEKAEPVHATAATQRALEILRVNHGLYTLDQAPLIRQLMRNALALGDHETAWDLEQELLRLAEREPNDLRTAEILRDTADRRMEILERYNAGQSPPEVVLGCYYDDHPPTSVRHPIVEGGAHGYAGGDSDKSCTSGGADGVRRNLVNEAQSYYAHAVNALMANEHYASEEIPSLLGKLVESSYRYANPNLGRRSLRYLLAYQTTNAQPWLARIETLVQIADWDLLYALGRQDQDMALAEYAEARKLCEEHGIPQAEIDRLFSPEIPVRLPTFFKNPLVTSEAGAKGHIDVGFEVDGYGYSSRVRTRATAGNAPLGLQRSLERAIKGLRFRPQLVHGEFADTGPIVVRYHVGAAGPPAPPERTDPLEPIPAFPRGRE